MVAALLALLLLGIFPPATAQQVEPGSPPRFLQLPDVTLSAEDPLYLSPPPVAPWSPVQAGQPSLDRLRLSPVETPFRILPSQEPPRALPPGFSQVPPGALPPAAISLPGGPAVTPPAGGQPSLRPAPAGTPMPEPQTGEYGAEFRHVLAESTRADLRLDRNLGSWALSGDAACALADPYASFALLQLQALRPTPPWRWDLRSGASAVFSADSLFAGGLEASAGLELEGERLRFQARSEARVEYWRMKQGASGRVFQELAVYPNGEGFGLYGAARGSLLPGLGAARLEPDGLARLGVAWSAGRVALDLSAGGALLYFRERLAVYPEAQVEFRPASVLRIQAWLGPFLEAPIPLLFRAINEPSGQTGLHDQGGIAARGGLLLDLPKTGGAEITVQASDGFGYRLRDGALRWERARELQLDLQSAWTVLSGSPRRPEIAIQISGTAVLPLPAPELPLAHLLRRSLDGGLRFGFSKLPLELIMLAHWGEFPVQAEQALLTRSQSLFSGWMAALQLRGGLEQKLSWFGGVEVREPAEVRVVLGWATHTRSKQ
jgi:hypothetical protein